MKTELTGSIGRIFELTGSIGRSIGRNTKILYLVSQTLVLFFLKNQARPIDLFLRLHKQLQSNLFGQNLVIVC